MHMLLDMCIRSALVISVCVNELQIKMQNNSILTPTSSSSATPGTRFLVRATSFARQALQAQQKRMESPDVVAQNADVAADDAGSGGTVIDLDVMTREALCTLLAPFSSGASSAEAAPGSIAACRDAWHAAGQLPVLSFLLFLGRASLTIGPKV